MSTYKKYARELRDAFGYWANWLPGTPLALGDVGLLKGNVFTRISNLQELGIAFDVQQDPTKSEIEYSSEGAISITTKASGTVAPQGSALGEVDAGITVKFSKENAVYIKANGTSSPSIIDQISLGKTLIEHYKQGKWDMNWVVVTEVMNAESATVLISSSSDSKIEVKAKGKVEAAKLDIADAGLGFELMFSKDLSTRIITQALVPLFRAAKIKRKFWIVGPPIIKSMATEMHHESRIDLMTPEMATKNEELLYFGDADFEED